MEAPVMEPLYSPAELSKIVHVSAHHIRAACKRSAACNRLPHIELGEKTPHLKIALSDFKEWLEREKVR